ncbi:MAG: hypothetical protein LBP58_06575 [Azoarcus sp.]|jgi:hypothetical protein|nr:hypothetical protein [Azoarcus sp.]
MGYLIVTIPLIWAAVEIVYKLKKRGNPYGIYMAAIWLTLVPIDGVRVAVEYIIESNGINHTGVDFIPYALCSLGFCTLFSFALYKRKKEKNRRFLIPMGMNIAAILFFLFIDHFNIMVYYGDWCERGMPGPFEPSIVKEDPVPPEIHRQAIRDINALEEGKITQEEYDRRNVQRGILMDEFEAKFQAKKRQQREQSEPH